MPEFTIQKSIHGRRLGLTSTGGLVSDFNSTGRHGSSAVQMAAQMWGDAMHESIATGATADNIGVTTVSSGTSTAISIEVKAPVVGAYKEIHIATSASEATIGGTATSIIFKPAVGGVGSTLFASAANLAGKTITLRGMTTAQWAVIGSTGGLTIG